MQLRARGGRALLAGDSAGEQRGTEVDPHSLALGAELAEALHEWARVADAVTRNGQSGGTAGLLISRRGHQLAARLAAVMGQPVSYADPLTGEVVEVGAPERQPDRAATARSRTSEPEREGSPPATPARERPPWGTGITVSVVTGILLMILVITLSLALGAANRWLPLIANIVIAIGLAPSVWLARRTPVWRWVAFGVIGGIVVGWIALLFTAL